MTALGAPHRSAWWGQAWRQYQAAAEAWTQPRDEAYRAAAGAAAHRAVFVDQVGPRAQQRRAREAGEAAACLFERQHPVPTWTDDTTPAAQPLYSATTGDQLAGVL